MGEVERCRERAPTSPWMDEVERCREQAPGWRKYWRQASRGKRRSSFQCIAQHTWLQSRTLVGDAHPTNYVQF